MMTSRSSFTTATSCAQTHWSFWAGWHGSCSSVAEWWTSAGRHFKATRCRPISPKTASCISSARIMAHGKGTRSRSARMSLGMQRPLKITWVSPGLWDQIVSRVAELYLNAFEHSKSPIGIMACGQYFKGRNELTLAIGRTGRQRSASFHRDQRPDDQRRPAMHADQRS